MDCKKIFIVLAVVGMAASYEMPNFEMPDLSKFTDLLDAVKGGMEKIHLHTIPVVRLFQCKESRHLSLM